MITEVIVPVLDQTTTEVRLINWIKNEGDEVTSGEVVCEIETQAFSSFFNKPLIKLLLPAPDGADITNTLPISIIPNIY